MKRIVQFGQAEFGIIRLVGYFLDQHERNVEGLCSVTCNQPRESGLIYLVLCQSSICIRL